MVGWHHQLNGHESEQTLGHSRGQRSLACCSPRGQEESDTAQRLNCNRHTCREMQRLSLCTGDKPLYCAWEARVWKEFGKTVALSEFLYNKDTHGLLSSLLKKFKNHEGTIIKWNQSKKEKN